MQNPGPDILVCDEAHMIKNGKADITQVLKQVRSKRRVALTGSPLQNNLMEYYCVRCFQKTYFELFFVTHYTTIYSTLPRPDNAESM